MAASRLPDALAGSLAGAAAWSAWPWWREAVGALGDVPAAAAPLVALALFRLAQGALCAGVARAAASVRGNPPERRCRNG